jgi:hypothetical protein
MATMRAQLHKTSIPNPRHAKDHGLINHLTQVHSKKHFFSPVKRCTFLAASERVATAGMSEVISRILEYYIASL